MKKIFLGILILISLILGINNSYSYINGNGENIPGPEEAPTQTETTGEGLESVNYKVDTTYLFGQNSKIKQTTAKLTIEEFLKVTVNKLLIGFGVLALFIMTIGGGYMIFAAGQDELLNKGKSIFNSGLIALLVALGSGIIMKLVIYLLY